MNSILTRERPDLWQRSLALATSLTHCNYAPKVPLADGTIYACGGYAPPYVPPKPKTPEQIEKERIDGIKSGINSIDEQIRVWKIDIVEKRKEVERIEKIIEDLEERRRRLGESLQAAGWIFVPEGAMEWLLHEVGHYVAATDKERAMPNYGLSDDIVGTVGGYQKIVIPSDHRAEREWQAWGFQEIILAPFGPARGFTPPTQRDGVAFAKTGPMPTFALHHAERRIATLGIDVEAWRVLYNEWIQYERRRAVPSWKRIN